VKGGNFEEGKMEKQFRSFAEFYPFYLSEHQRRYQNRKNRNGAKGWTAACGTNMV
jgi:hypothetical protein